ncbi:unnamed protein product, partial [Closterium sp. NIES-54]
HLIGRPARVVDCTTLSTTGLATCPSTSGISYASDLLHSLGLSHWLPLLPEILPPTQPCGTLSVEAAERMGARHLAGIPVFHSCGDLGASAVGCGSGLPGTEYIYLGTSGWVAGSFPLPPPLQPATQPPNQQPNQPSTHPPPLASQPLASVQPPSWSQGVFTLAHPDPSLVFRTAPIMTAGGNLKWAINTLLGSSGNDVAESAFQNADVAAASVPAGSGGLLYLPFLNGERCPFEDPNMRAAFIGISASTTQAHMIRAVQEGVAYALISAHIAMQAHSGGSGSSKPSALRIVGGGARFSPRRSRPSPSRERRKSSDGKGLGIFGSDGRGSVSRSNSKEARDLLAELDACVTTMTPAADVVGAASSSAGISAQSLALVPARARGGSGGNWGELMAGRRAEEAAAVAAAVGEESAEVVMGILWKWVNLGRGWGMRLFVLEGGLLSYFKLEGPDRVTVLQELERRPRARLIGDEIRHFVKKEREDGVVPNEGELCDRMPHGSVRLEVSTLRASTTDGRKFYVFGTKTLGLRTESKAGRLLWMDALQAAKMKHLQLIRASAQAPSINDSRLVAASSLAMEPLRAYLASISVGVEEIAKCEEIVRRQVVFRLENKLREEQKRRLQLLRLLRQLEADKVELETAMLEETRNQGYAGTSVVMTGDGDDASTTFDEDEEEEDDEEDDEEEAEGEEEDGGGDQEVDSSAVTISGHGLLKRTGSDLRSRQIGNSGRRSRRARSKARRAAKADVLARDNDEDEGGSGSSGGQDDEFFEAMDDFVSSGSVLTVLDIQEVGFTYPKIPRRDRLPPPAEEEKPVSIWSILKDLVGKDLFKVSLPVSFNEPISTNQKYCETYEYSWLLDRAAEYGRRGNKLMRAVHVAAFAVSRYSGNAGRMHKPFNPLLGETFEADCPDKGFRYVSEAVS